MLERLAGAPEVSEVRSVARRDLPTPPGLAERGKKFVHARGDITCPGALAVLDGADVVYHLAAQVWPDRGPAGMRAMHSANVTGALNVLRARVGAVVVASSAAVYGAWPDNALPMDEQRAPRPNPQCAYAQQKLVVENICSSSTVPWTIVRLCAVLGPHADARVARSVRGYRLVVPAVRGVPQAVQWMDEEDAVSGLLAAGNALLQAPLTVHGEVFNLATSDWLTASDVARLAGGRMVELNLRQLLSAAELGRLARLTPFGQDRAVLVNGPLAIDPLKASGALGWRALKASAEVLAAALQRDWRQAPRNRRP